MRREIVKLITTRTGESLDQAAQMLEDVLDTDEHPGRMNDLFKKILQEKIWKMDDKSIMKDRLKWLKEIPFKAILTTNFDTLIPNSTSWFSKSAEDQCHRILRSPPKNFGGN